MNAKSLSTILHLKSLAEQLTQEKEILDQKSKSSAQLALAARLAANAKERLEEEVLREKKVRSIIQVMSKDSFLLYILIDISMIHGI
jgi:regulator of sirC expression with transglutaminase-like and TPR domain